MKKPELHTVQENPSSEGTRILHHTLAILESATDNDLKYLGITPDSRDVLIEKEYLCVIKIMNRAHVYRNNEDTTVIGISPSFRDQSYAQKLAVISYHLSRESYEQENKKESHADIAGFVAVATTALSLEGDIHNALLIPAALVVGTLGYIIGKHSFDYTSSRHATEFQARFSHYAETITGEKPFVSDEKGPHHSVAASLKANVVDRFLDGHVSPETINAVNQTERAKARENNAPQATKPLDALLRNKSAYDITDLSLNAVAWQKVMHDSMSL